MDLEEHFLYKINESDLIRAIMGFIQEGRIIANKSNVDAN